MASLKQDLYELDITKIISIGFHRNVKLPSCQMRVYVERGMQLTPQPLPKQKRGGGYIYIL